MSDPNGTRTTATAPYIPHHPLVPDIVNAILLGDFCRTLGPAGAVTQVILNFIPGIGTLTAMRDLVADIRKPEPLGIVLNGLSVIPVLGGFTKTAEVMSHVSFAGESFVCLHGLEERAAFRDGEMHPIPKNRLARISVMAAFFTPFVAVVLAVLAVLHFIPLAALWAVFALPVLAIFTGHIGVLRAKRLRRITPGLQIEPGIISARAGAALGWLAVFFLGLSAPGVALIASVLKL